MSQQVRNETGALGRAFTRLGDDTDHANRPLHRLHQGLSALLPDFSRLGAAARSAEADLARFGQSVEGLGIALAIKYAVPLITSLIALGGVLMSLVTSLGLATAGLIALATAAIAQAIPAIGLLVFAFKGLTSVMAVVKLREQERTNAAADQAAAAKQVAAAEDTVTAARQRQTEATKELKDAEEAMADARLSATRHYQDTMFAERRAVLNRRDAELSLLEAKERLRAFDSQISDELASKQIEAGQAKAELAGLIAAGADATSIARAQARVEETDMALKRVAATEPDKALERKRLQLGVDQAQLGVTDARRQETRAEQDANRARRDGIKGSDEMKAATDRVRRAQQNLRSANEALTKSQKDLTEATDATSASAKKLAEAWDKLSPAQRALVIEIEKFKKLTQGPIGGVRDTILFAFVDVLKILRQLLSDPAIVKALQGLAQAMADAIREIAKASLTGEGKNKFIKFIEDAAKNIPILTDALIDLGGALANMVTSSEGSELVTKNLEGFADLMDRFRNWSGSPKMEKFLERAGQHLQAWKDLTRAFFNLMSALSGGSSQEGLTTIEKITKQFNDWAKWMREHPEKTKKFFRESRQVAELLWKVIEAIAKALGRAFKPDTVKSMVNFFTQVLIPAFGNALLIMGEFMKIIHNIFSGPVVYQISRVAATVAFLGVGFQMVMRAGLFFLGIFGPMLAGFGRLLRILPYIIFNIRGLGMALKGLFLTNPLGWILLLVTILYELDQRFHIFAKTLDWLKEKWESDWGGIRTTLERFWKWVTGTFWPALQRVFNAIRKVVGEVADFFVRHWGSIKRILELFWKFVTDVWWPGVKVAFELFKNQAKLLWEQFKNYFDLITGLLGNFKRVLGGVVDFIVGVFTGDWRRAWKGLKNIFAGMWNGMLDVLDFFLNTFRNAWNWLVGALDAIPGINIKGWKIEHKISLEKWVGAAEGGVFGAGSDGGGIYQPVPGGIYRIAEAGHPEAVIPLDPSLRARASTVLEEVLKIMGVQAPGFQIGGVIGGIRDVGAKVAGGAKRTAGAIIGAAVGPLWRKFLDKIGFDRIPEWIKVPVGALLHALKSIIPGLRAGGIVRPTFASTWSNPAFAGSGVTSFQHGGITSFQSVDNSRSSVGNVELTVNTTQPDVDIDYVLMRIEQQYGGGT